MKKIFGRLQSADLIKQITTISLFMSLGVVLQYPLDFHFGPIHIFSSTIIFSFLMIAFTDWRLSLLGSMTMITLGELIITYHHNFWTNYAPMFIAIIIMHSFKLFKNFWFSILGILIGIIQFELSKAFIAYLVYDNSLAYLFMISGLIQIGTGSIIVIPIYASLYKIVKSMNKSIYSYNE